jgi:hypothetical protein
MTRTEPLPDGMRRFVVRAEDGEPIAAYAAHNRDHAIEQFCWPALLWAPLEMDGWTCREDRT